MKRKTIWLFVIAAFGTLLQACEVRDVLPPRERERGTSGSWLIGAGVNLPQSYRNFHYNFTVDKDNTALDITLESPDTEVALWLYNPLGQLVESNWGSRSIRINAENMSPGEYRVIAGTSQRGESGTFTLKMKGSDTDLALIPSETLTAANEWKTNGGGVNHPQSLRNHQYTFEVTEDNSAVDVVLESDDADLAIWLYNPLGQQIGYTWGDRSHFIVEEADKGTYTVVAGTYQRNVQQADYRLNINGKVANIQQVTAQDAVATGTIANGAGLNNPQSPTHGIYTLDVTENNTSLDVILESADFDVALWIYNPNGQLVNYTWGDRRLFLVENVSAGKYTVICGTTAAGSSGNYRLSVVGKFRDFAKQ